MNMIYATYNIHHNSIDVYTHAGYFLRIDCNKAEEGLKTTPCSECALNALAIDEPLDVCRECDFADRFDITGNYWITDYEVPAYFYGKGIGEIDLIISDGKTQYATELKPYKGNTETLLRMIAEIMTYTIGYPTGKYVKTIAFFEGTKQAAEFEKAAPEIKELLTKANISVFVLKKQGRKRIKYADYNSLWHAPNRWMRCRNKNGQYTDFD